MFSKPNIQELYEYIANPKVKSGNELRYPDLALKGVKRKHGDVTFDDATGIFRVSKYGPKFDIWHYAPSVPKHIREYACVSLATNSWASYRSGWNSYTGFVRHFGYTVTLPATVTMLLHFITFLHVWRHLSVSTISSYLTAVKKLHELNHCGVTQFGDKDIRMTLKGMTNLEAISNTPGLLRNVMTFEILMLWGCAVQRSNLSFKDKLVLWTVSLIAFWTAARMGELLQTETSSIDVIRVITWDKIKAMDQECIK